MAILTSPGIKVLEVDNTAFPPTIDSSVVGLVGFASKGPTNIATLITTPDQLIDVFGEPSEDILGQALEGALEILEATNNIYFVRAADATAADASASINLGSCPSFVIADRGFGVTSALTLAISAWDNTNTLVASEIYQFPIGTDGATNQLQALQKKLPAGTGIGLPYGVYSINGSSVLASHYAGQYARLAAISFSSVSSTYTSFPTSSLTPIAMSTGATGWAPSGTIPASTVLTYGVTFDDLKLQVNSLYPGNGYNYTVKSDGTIAGNGVEIDFKEGEFFDFTVNNKGVSTETFKATLNVTDSQYFIENQIPDSTESASDYVGVDILSGTSPFANVSSYTGFSGTYNIGAATQLKFYTAGSPSLLTGTANAPTPRFIKPVGGTYNLAGGTNGIPDSGNESAINTAIIGNAAERSGLYALDDDLLNISIAAVPAINTQAVQNQLITLAESTQNFLALVSPGYGTIDTVQEAVDWVNGRSTARTAAINSSWAAAHWPWVQVFSTFDGKDRWYDPVIYAARQMCYTDNVAEPWFAAAGYRRGRLTKPTATEVSLSQGDRDVLYENNINPIVNFRPEGITIFGQKTLQRIATVLDRINVRRLMIFLRKILLGLGRQYIMEPNDEFTWELVETALNPVLSDIQNRRGLVAYRVICDETVNTPERVARNELWCKIILQPTTVAEFIVFELNLTTQAAKLGL